MNVSDVKGLADRIREEIAKAVVGQGDTVDLILTALAARLYRWRLEMTRERQ